MRRNLAIATVVLLTSGPAVAESMKLSDAQMEMVTAGQIDVSAAITDFIVQIQFDTYLTFIGLSASARLAVQRYIDNPTRPPLGFDVQRLSQPVVQLTGPFAGNR